MMRNGLDRQSCCNISFACPGTSNEHDVVSIIDERAGVQLPEQGLVDITGCEVKTCHILVGREAR